MEAPPAPLPIDVEVTWESLGLDDRLLRAISKMVIPINFYKTYKSLNISDPSTLYCRISSVLHLCNLEPFLLLKKAPTPHRHFAIRCPPDRPLSPGKDVLAKARTGSGKTAA